MKGMSLNKNAQISKWLAILAINVSKLRIKVIPKGSLNEPCFIVVQKTYTI